MSRYRGPEAGQACPRSYENRLDVELDGMRLQGHREQFFLRAQEALQEG